MTQRILTATFVLAVGAFALASTSAEAQGRKSGRAVPRTAPPPVVRVQPRIVRPQVVRVVPYYAPRYYSPRYFAYPVYPGPPHGNAYGYYRNRGYVAPGYYATVPGRSYGGVRIDLPQRDAQVFVGGYYVGIVDQYDGVFQRLDLEPGPHRIEVRAPGYEPIAFDIRVQPGKTITYRASLHPLP